MVKLTETLVLQRTKKYDLQSIRTLNCWGSDLTDVSVIRNMPRIQTISFSVNQISTLVDFSYCTCLEELYLRKNAITDLNELYHLQGLASLRVLWLAENPCAEYSDYRASVLGILPSLQILDNQPVTAEEVKRASCKPVESVQQILMLRRPADTDAEASITSACVFEPVSDDEMLRFKPNTNVLQAVLTLINELDRGALEVVDDAVQNLLQV